MPLAIPDEEPIVAMESELLLHVPPPGVAVNVVVEPTHTVGATVVIVGNELTFTVAVAEHPVLETV